MMLGLGLGLGLELGLGLGFVCTCIILNINSCVCVTDDDVVLRFGRVGPNRFNMDFCYPLSPIQAFGICLSRFYYLR